MTAANEKCWRIQRERIVETLSIVIENKDNTRAIYFAQTQASYYLYCRISILDDDPVFRKRTDYDKVKRTEAIDGPKYFRITFYVKQNIDSFTYGDIYMVIKIPTRKQVRSL